jgi:hypothetical protein
VRESATVSRGGRPELERLRKRLRDRPIDLVVRARHSLPFDEAVACALPRLGFGAGMVGQDRFAPEPGRIVLMRGNASWFLAAFERLAAKPAGERPFLILWETEPLPLPEAAGLKVERPSLGDLARIALHPDLVNDPRSNVRRIRRLVDRGLIDLLVVSTLGGQRFLSDQGIPAAHVPLGYIPDHGRDLGLERDIDVLFIGELGIRRRKRAFRRLARDGLRIETVGDWTDPSCWGEERTRLLNRVKILLNIPRHPGILSGARMLLGMANKALVVAEPVYLPDPYVPGRHYLSAPLDELSDLVGEALADEPGRLRVTEAAHRFVTEELTVERSLTTVLALVAERLARSEES